MSLRPVVLHYELAEGISENEKKDGEREQSRLGDVSLAVFKTKARAMKFPDNPPEMGNRGLPRTCGDSVVSYFPINGR